MKRWTSEVRGFLAIFAPLLAFAAWCLIIALVGCASPPILGGPTPATTSHPCLGGGSCPNGWSCPPLSNPTGLCEAPLGLPPEQWAAWRAALDGSAP